MTEREYNELKAVRRSDLWKIMESPEKYLYATTHTEAPTPALVFGAAAHKLLLEPDGFFDEYFVMPGDLDRRTKAGREAYERLLVVNEGRSMIADDVFRDISAMVETAHRSALARKLLYGEHETSFVWQDQDTGLMCKTRLDCLSEPDGNLTVVDYKTVADARTSSFNRDIFKYGYHMQAYMYTESVMQVRHLSERPDFVFIAQEKKAPYALNVVKVDEDVMMAGMDAFRLCLGTLKECQDMDYYWGYNGRFDEMNETELPGWVTTGGDDV